jgi:dGTP triphosphohydrolase
VAFTDIFDDKPMQAIELPQDASSLDLLQACYRNASLPLSTRIRCAIAALQHEHPRLGVTAIAQMSDDFAARLERAIMRSTTKVIEHEPREPTKVEVETKPHLPAVPDRRFRRV